MSRWLVHSTSWGVISTLSRQQLRPEGGVVSHSDGDNTTASGRLFFYLTSMDFSTQNLQVRRACGADNPRLLLVVPSAALPTFPPCCACCCTPIGGGSFNPNGAGARTHSRCHLRAI